MKICVRACATKSSARDSLTIDNVLLCCPGYSLWEANVFGVFYGFKIRNILKKRVFAHGALSTLPGP